jgi:hypothetical protein
MRIFPNRSRPPATKTDRSHFTRCGTPLLQAGNWIELILGDEHRLVEASDAAAHFGFGNAVLRAVQFVVIDL